MDLHRFTTAQLYIMHATATAGARAALKLAEHKSLELLELASTCDHDEYNVANAEFTVLMAQADDHRAYSRQIYDEIVRRAQAPRDEYIVGPDGIPYGPFSRGGRTGNGTRYCRSCGFTDCPSLTDGGDCPRWPARDDTSEVRDA